VKLHRWLIAWLVAVFCWSAAEAQQQAVPEGTAVLKDLAYVTNGHERQKLDLYVPQSDKPLPLIVWVHGGAWKQGSKDRTPALPLLRDGYAVASINYRLSQHATFPAQIEDCKAAIRWLRANSKKYNLNPDRVGVWGASAGGHLVALLGTTGDVKALDGNLGNTDRSSRVQCVCDWFGPTDFRQIGSAGGAAGPVAELLGGPVSDKKEIAAQASPVTHVTKDDAPFLIMHGDKDSLVPLSQSQVLVEALKKAGVEVDLRVLEGAGHGGAQFTSPESMKMIREFFDKHLRLVKQ
jgi:acetyl esterase/lipase